MESTPAPFSDAVAVTLHNSPKWTAKGRTEGDSAGFNHKLATSWQAPAAAAGEGSTSNGRLIRTKLTGSAVIVGR